MPDRILITGGTGKTGSRAADRLRAMGISPRIATRRPQGPDMVAFDWSDADALKAAFADIEAVYLVAPTDTFDSLGTMRPGLEIALAQGVRRFVLLSASSVEEGGPMMGAVHAWLRDNAPEWAVLRPSWFMQNLSEGQHLSPIRDEAAIYSATRDGRVGFIDAEDIAACAAELLARPRIENTDHILTGPESLSYDGVAAALSNRLGRDIAHRRLSVQGISDRFADLGLPRDYADTLAGMDDQIARDAENRTTGAVEAITGRAPGSLDRFIERNLAVWNAKAA